MVTGERDTIAAIATAAGGGVGILRLSGPGAIALGRRHFRALRGEAKPRLMVHGWWRDEAGERVDEGLGVIFPGPASYTGEDVVEVHLHGGALGLRRALEVALDAGARLAEPGEFTRRAFLSGRMDLTRAEAVADLIAARTDRALAQARGLLAGRLYERAMDARERLLRLRARVEVQIDFVEEDLPEIDLLGLAGEAEALGEELAALAATWAQGRLVREGARVVLIGGPNAGKSSLFNALCAADRAIVTEIAGTTRDTLEETLDLEGIPVVLIDTAGLREDPGRVEQIGIERARREVGRADLVVHLAGGEGGGSAAPHGALRVTSRCDRADVHPAPETLAVSAVTGEGLRELRLAIATALGASGADPSALMITHERHHRALLSCAESLEEVAEGLRGARELELVAVDLQEAMDALASLVGLITLEDVLDRLFSEFCIGK